MYGWTVMKNSWLKIKCVFTLCVCFLCSPMWSVRPLISDFWFLKHRGRKQMVTTLQETFQMHISGRTCMFITFVQQFVSGGPVDRVSLSNDLAPNWRQVINWTLMTQHSDRPISEFPSQTCALLLLSLHSVCHVTIAHCNDSNGTDTRVRVRCNDSDVTDRKQSGDCNDSTVWQTWVELSLHMTDILTVDKVRFESPKTWNYIGITLHWM